MLRIRSTRLLGTVLALAFLLPSGVAAADPADSGRTRADHRASRDPALQELADRTSFSPSEAGASGTLVTTAADTARFYRALLGGRLLAPAVLRQMLDDTVPTTHAPRPAVGYGLGVYVYATDCGPAYGHGGSAADYLTYVLNSRDGRSQVVAHTNWNPFDAGMDEPFWAAFQKGYCGKRR
ncbi:serine hydrolase domain-containing protein [Streptomyces sp. NPDC047071]|uniref:serine hydrolase domain-containing protein n=1 Tax=Streptomyces sp. NPDC047071 TaxID=3154808 RepID=UPI003453DCAC